MRVRLVIRTGANKKVFDDYGGPIPDVGDHIELPGERFTVGERWFEWDEEPVLTSDSRRTGETTLICEITLYPATRARG